MKQLTLCLAGLLCWMVFCRAEAASIDFGTVAKSVNPKITVTVSGFTHTAIQTAVDTVAANAVGGKVIVPAGTYECEGSIELKSNVELNLASGAILNATTNWRNFAELPTTAYERTIEHSRRVFIWGTNMTDVAITGEGRIEGQGRRCMRPRHHLPSDGRRVRAGPCSRTRSAGTMIMRFPKAR